MKIKSIRQLDYWAGVPLCFLLSVWESFSSKAPRKEIPVKKIAFIKLPELGAIVLAYPLLRQMKRKYPSAEIFFVTLGRNRGVFDLLDGIVPPENILTIREDSPAQMLSDGWAALQRLRREKIDFLFDLEFFSRLTSVFSYLTGARMRVGFHPYTYEGLYRGNLLTHKIQYNPLSHVARTYLSMAQAADLPSKTTPEMQAPVDEKALVFPKHVSSDEPKRRLLDKLKAAGIDAGSKLFLVNAGEGVLPLREWPLDYFIELSRRLLDEKDARIVLIGTEGASQKADDLLRAVNDKRCASLVQQTSLDELMELFGIAEALISNDCGLAHLAMLSPVKKFILFGPESPQVFGPLGTNTWLFYSNWPCSPCLSAFNNRLSDCADNRCLKAIPPADVLAQIRKACF